MALATFKLHGKDIPYITEKVADIITKLTNNVATYATPVPSVMVLTAANDKLSASFQAAINGGKDLKALMMLDRKALLTLMTTLLGYIQATSAGDPARILLVADVKSERTPVGILGPPPNVRGVFTGLDGQIKWMWDGVSRKLLYKTQINATPDVPDGWTDLVLTGKINHISSGLVSGQMYGFRVATISSAGTGAWSDVSLHKAL